LRIGPCLGGGSSLWGDGKFGGGSERTHEIGILRPIGIARHKCAAKTSAPGVDAAVSCGYHRMHGDNNVISDMVSMDIRVGALLVLLAGLATGIKAQQPSPLIANVEGRQTISLNGAWETIIDPYETGYYDYRYEPSTNGYFKNAKPTSSSDLVEYDFDTSPQLNVPGDLVLVRREPPFLIAQLVIGIPHFTTNILFHSLP
jgi:hypothetical protein